MWNTPKRVIAAQRLAGYDESETTGNGLPFVLFLLIAPLGTWYLQRELNRIWERETEQAAAPQVTEGAPRAA
jgi:hypothetical protein